MADDILSENDPALSDLADLPGDRKRLLAALESDAPTDDHRCKLQGRLVLIDMLEDVLGAVGDDTG
jgi:hypothetical protein